MWGRQFVCWGSGLSGTRVVIWSSSVSDGSCSEGGDVEDDETMEAGERRVMKSCEEGANCGGRLDEIRCGSDRPLDRPVS